METSLRPSKLLYGRKFPYYDTEEELKTDLAVIAKDGVGLYTWEGPGYYTVEKNHLEEKNITEFTIMSANKYLKERFIPEYVDSYKQLKDKLEIKEEQLKQPT